MIRSVHYAIGADRLLRTSLRPESRIRLRMSTPPNLSDAMRTALRTVEIARRLGVTQLRPSTWNALPYGDGHDQLVFPAPLLSEMAGEEIVFLRGWSEFQSCVKGFNALGLIAEQTLLWENAHLDASPRTEEALRQEFAAAKRIEPDATLNIPMLDIVLWNCLRDRTIVCSTSSNMGISLHEALRLMQRRRETGSSAYRILDEHEGSLIIWCPDERADFMNPEKSRILRALESEEPKLTSLRTYINRQQRDPGALLDALSMGGYFFPTNPQSASEIQNLLYLSIIGDSDDPVRTTQDMLAKETARRTLMSLGCEIDDEHSIVHVERGVEGGIHGLMVPYLFMLEDCLGLGIEGPFDTWNQASIGAALAAAVLAEMVFRDASVLVPDVRAHFDDIFPRLASRCRDLSSFADRGGNRITGVFDIANIQSLAQLLGVVVERHLAGRSTAFVGLGSSSYSNGNRCFEILQGSIDVGGPFPGRKAFEPATHTLNPVAQALVFLEDRKRIQKLANSVGPAPRKPEPAGAAALAGYLLRQLDADRLSVFEIAKMLRHGGFDRDSFLEFHSGRSGREAGEAFVQSGMDEGSYMGQFASDLLELLAWPIGLLEAEADRQRSYREIPSEDHGYTRVIYLTGDNCTQPSADFELRLN